MEGHVSTKHEPKGYMEVQVFSAVLNIGRLQAVLRFDTHPYGLVGQEHNISIVWG